MDELLILIARLGWPSTSCTVAYDVGVGGPARRTNCEGRNRGCAAPVAALAHTRGRGCREVLCIFWMAARGHGYSPAAGLAKSIPKPSLLSDLLMVSLGLSVEAGDANLKEVPDDFVVSDDFDGVQGVDLPRIFRTSMKRLEALSGLPFVRQMAFELTENRVAYPDAPYQGDPWHFRPCSATVSSASLPRAPLFAPFPPTFARWRWPSRSGTCHWRLRTKNSLLALPVHPTFALLRPRRPDWFPSPADFDGNTEALEAGFRALVARVEAARPGDELISFISPVVMSMERCVEVSLVRWSQAQGSSIDDADLAAHLDPFWAREQMLHSAVADPLSATTIVVPPILEQLVDDDCKAWPLAATLDYDRMGYLQHDLYPSRLFFPTVPGLHEVEVTPRDGQLEIKAEDQVVADFCYWNAGWGLARPRLLRGNCGTALISRGTRRTARVPAMKAGRCGRSTFGRYVHCTVAAASTSSGKH